MRHLPVRDRDIVRDRPASLSGSKRIAAGHVGVRLSLNISGSRIAEEFPDISTCALAAALGAGDGGCVIHEEVLPPYSQGRLFVKLHGPPWYPQNNIHAYSSEYAVCNRIGERHDDDGQEGRNGLLRFVPWNVIRVCHQHDTDQNQRRSGCIRWDGGQNRAEKQRDEEEERHRQRNDARPATFLDARRILQVDGHRRDPHHTADDDTYSVR
mmetsp:Transcript_10837/g.30243  ORF Transcript_10837/g.30243 Transcript_10837/m.30243 type:complete len:211 (-) Transcript_10837:3355-3987(-)